jgi:membrane protease subunit HflK
MAPDSRNPWDRKPPEKPNPWGSGGPGNNRGNNNPPDLDEMMKKLNDKFSNVFPGGIGPVQVGLALFAVIFVFWLLSGFYLVSPGENAVITRFGAWQKTQQDPGLGYRLPWPIEDSSILKVAVDRRIQIGFDEPSSREARRNVSDESQMLTADANIVELGVIVIWNIENAKDYLFNIRDPEETVRKVATSALREVVGQNDLWPIVTGSRNDVQTQTQKITQDILDKYKSGISIKNVTLQQATVHPDVVEAYEDVMAAKQDADRSQNEAKIYSNKIVPQAGGDAAALILEARGYKDSVIAKAQGDATRFNTIYVSYLQGKDVTRERLYIETMEQVMKNAQKIIVDRSASGSGVVPYMPLNELKPAAGGSDDEPVAAAPTPTVTVPPRNSSFGSR